MEGSRTKRKWQAKPKTPIHPSIYLSFSFLAPPPPRFLLPAFFFYFPLFVTSKNSVSPLATTSTFMFTSGIFS